VNRRGFLTATTAAAVGIAGCAGTRSTPEEGTDADADDAADTSTTARADAGSPASATREDAPSSVGLETLATGLETPVDVVFPGDDRRYVAEQRGLIRVHGPDGLLSEPLLDLRDGIVTGFEQGLLGLALHPSFAENRRLFVRYSAPPRQGTPRGYSHTFVLAEFRVGEDGTTADPGSERTILEIPEPQSNHNAGSIVFGPDGLLYVGVGDGGAGGDQGRGHVDDWYEPNDGGNGQDVTENLLGSVLRIDVDGRADGTAYAIPGDNPLVGREGLDEQYAWGFRNPWRLAVDGDDLYAGDVGQNAFEEIDRVERGGNYGWNVREGTHCFGASPCPDRAPVRDGERFVAPVVEYPHSGAAMSGISVIVGNVYRGETLPWLRGRFVFGDWRAGGRLFVADPTGGDGRWPTGVLPVADGDAGVLRRLYSFGRHDGELYVLASGDGGGGLHRLAPPG
jgi:glucose/arabinose dehydrogenase